MKKKTLIIIAIPIFILGIYLLVVNILFPMMVKRRAVKEVTSFTNTQIMVIADKLNIAEDELKIDKMKYSQPRDKVFIVYAHLSNLKSIEDNYSEQNDSSGKKIFNNNNNKNISCKLNSDIKPYEAIFTIDEFDKSLEDIVIH